MSLNWQKIKLGNYNVADLIMGISPSSQFYNGKAEGIPFLQGSAQFGEVYPVTDIFTSTAIKIAERGDTLISVRAPVGDLNIADKKYCIGRGLAAVRAKESIDSKFLFYSLLVSKYKIQSESSGSTFKSVNKSVLENFEIFLPPIPTQQKIVAVLDAIQAEISQQKEIIEKTKELKKSLMKKLFSKGTRGEKLKETKIGKMPESWEVGVLQNLAKVIYGKSNPNNKGTYPIFGSSGVYGNTNQILVNKPTIIIGRKGTAGASYFYDGPCWVSDTAFYLDINTNSVEPKFLYLCLDFFKFRISGKHDKTTLPSLKRQDLENFKFSLPKNLKEQAEIASILQKVDDRIEIAREQKKLHEELFSNTLHKIMAGEIDVKNL